MQYSNFQYSNELVGLQFKVEGVSRHELDSFYAEVTQSIIEHDSDLPPASLYDFSHQGVVLTSYLEHTLTDLLDFLNTNLDQQHSIAIISGTLSFNNSLNRVVNEHLYEIESNLHIEIFPTHSSALRWLNSQD